MENESKKEKFQSKMQFFQDEWMKLKQNKEEEVKNKDLNTIYNLLKETKNEMKMQTETLQNEIKDLKENMKEMNKEIMKNISKIELKLKEDKEYVDEDIAPYKTMDIWQAAAGGVLPAVKYYIKQDPSCINAIDPKYPFHWTPLHYACEDGYLYIVKYLISQGVDINCRTKQFQDTALHLASVYGHLHIIKYLLSLDMSYINGTNSKKFTPLHQAAIGGFLECCKYLVENGADPNLKNMDNKTPLNYAQLNKHKNIIDYLEPLTLNNESS